MQIEKAYDFYTHRDKSKIIGEFSAFSNHEYVQTHFGNVYDKKNYWPKDLEIVIKY